ncbi:putative non-specific serine/threonine protein kinase [Rosa chinensis]|uniref:Putative non-specific serine/threonine protein kinase n=1 Tax=Rosa chinensis TaxID=74649 RepID=A0A2P6P9G2_ROSCH|nr:putative non-specific serine/threonine protein kinase [Rosa chinensis]
MIPKFIGSLSQLKQLRLGEANFSGLVPPQLGNLSNLHTLDLSRNFAVHSENLEWLSDLSSLRYLNMVDVDLSKVVNWPQSLSKLTLLTELQLSWCRLPGVNLRSLSFTNSSTSLQLLDLSYNNLNFAIFYWIANVSSNFVHSSSIRSRTYMERKNRSSYEFIMNFGRNFQFSISFHFWKFPKIISSLPFLENRILSLLRAPAEFSTLRPPINAKTPPLPSPRRRLPARLDRFHRNGLKSGRSELQTLNQKRSTPVFS